MSIRTFLFVHHDCGMPCQSGADPGFGGTPVGGSEIFSPQKRDFRHSEAKAVCFNISFSKVKFPFFFALKYNKAAQKM